MAAPLQALREGHAAWAVGVLLALFAAAPVVLALPAGRLADRHGYHRPMRIAVALTVAGGLLRGAVDLARQRRLRRCCACRGLLTGAGANFGLIAIQRTAGRMAHDATELQARLQLARPGAGALQRRRAGARRHADRPRRLPRRLPRAGAAAAGQPGWARLVPVEAACRRRRAPPRGTARGTCWRAGLAPPAARQLAAVVVLGRAHASWCRCSATSAASAPRRSAPSSARSRSRWRWCGW